MGWSKIAGESLYHMYIFFYHWKGLSLLIVFEVWGMIKTFTDKNK